MVENENFARTKEMYGKKADWNMAVYEFDRFSDILKSGAMLAIEVRSGNLTAFNRFYAIECELVSEWNGYMNSVQRTKFTTLKSQIDKFMKAVTIDRRGQKQVNILLPSLLLEMWQHLHDFKAEINMGVPMRRDFSDEERLGKALK